MKGVKSKAEKEAKAKSIAHARESWEQKQKELENIEVELQVKSTAHAKSDEVLQFCVEQLMNGVTYQELRRKLGLGPSHIDYRWRVIRETLVTAALPRSDEEAYKANVAHTEYIIEKAEALLERVSHRNMHNHGAENEDKMIKNEIELLKMCAERYEKRMEQYINLEKIRSKEKASNGASIVFINNNYIPRPGDNAVDVTPEKKFQDVKKLTKVEGDVRSDQD